VLQVQPIEAKQLWKAAKGNDIWAFAVVECVQEAGEQTIPKSVQEVIDRFPNLFKDPKQLPPSRVSEPTLAVSRACAVAVAQAWCAWLVWALSGHTAWHMRSHWIH
jgi:hypothetical protein